MCSDENYEKMFLLSVLRILIFFLLGLGFLGAARLRFRPCPRSLLNRFCVDADTCFEMMPEVLTSGVLSAISDKILPPVRNASRPRLLAPDQSRGVPIEISHLKNCQFRDPSVNIEDLCR
jgi:hypothetical protein